MSPTRRLLRCERGAAAVEFAFIAMLLILGTVGIIEVGRALFMMNELAHAADRAARVVMLNPDILESDLNTAIKNPEAVNDRGIWVGLVPANVIVDVIPETPSSSDTFRDVTLSYAFTPMISNFTIGSVTLTADRRIAR